MSYIAHAQVANSSSVVLFHEPTVSSLCPSQLGAYWQGDPRDHGQVAGVNSETDVLQAPDEAAKDMSEESTE